MMHSYPIGARSRATASEAGPPPMSAMRLPFFCAAGFGSRARISSLKSAATRFSRQIATGSFSTRPRRHAGSQAVAGAPEDPREHVGFPIDHIGVAVTPSGDQADIFGHRSVCWTRPLAVHHLVKVVRDRNVGGLHLFLLHAASALEAAVRTLLRGYSSTRPLGLSLGRSGRRIRRGY